MSWNRNLGQIPDDPKLNIPGGDIPGVPDLEIFETELKLLFGWLFSHAQNDKHLRWGFLRYSTILPPVVYYDRDRDSKELKFTKIFEYERNGRKLDWRVLQLLMRRSVSPKERSFHILKILFNTRKTQTEKKTNFALLYKNLHEYEKRPLNEKGPSLRHVNSLFPLWRYENRLDGLTEFSLIDPFSHFLPTTKGIEKRYSALFRLFDYQRKTDGAKSLRILWRLFHREVDGKKKSLEMFPFIDTESEPGKKRFSIGWRLFEYQREGERRSLRLFFSPRISWGGEDSEAQE